MLQCRRPGVHRADRLSVSRLCVIKKPPLRAMVPVQQDGYNASCYEKEGHHRQRDNFKGRIQGGGGL